MYAEEGKKIVGHLLVQDFPAVQRLQQRHHFAWRGDVLAAFGGSFHIHHLPVKPGVRQSERIEQRIHVFHADAVDDDIGGGIVAYGYHQRRNVADRQPRNAGSHRVRDAASAD